MSTPARFCLRLGTLLLALMVTLLWAGPRAQSSTGMRTIDVSDPTVQLAYGVLQSDMPKAKLKAPSQPAPLMPSLFDVPAAPAVSDLIMPDEVVNVVAPAQAAATINTCEDV